MIAKDTHFSSDKVAERVGASLDLSGLEAAIAIEVADDEGLRTISSNASRALTSDQIADIKAAVQRALTAYGPLLAEDVLPVANEDSEYAFDVAGTAMNAGDTSLTAANVRTMKSLMAKKKAAARASISANATYFDSRETYADNYAKDTPFSKTSTENGDILYVYSDDMVGQAITGHAALWYRDRGEWLTADVPDGGSISDAHTDYYSSDNQIRNKTPLISIKTLHVKSDTTQEERVGQITAHYAAYVGRWYCLNLIKTWDWWPMGLYCSQVAWNVWNKLGVDLDSTPFSTSFLLHDIVQIGVPVTIGVGFLSVTFTIYILVVVVNLVTMDIVYPWDIVLSDRTTVYAQYGKELPFE